MCPTHLFYQKKYVQPIIPQTSLLYNTDAQDSIPAACWDYRDGELQTGRGKPGEYPFT